MNQMLDIDLRALEPLARIDRIPQQCARHDAAVDHAGVVHVQGIQISSFGGRETQHGNDEDDPCAGDVAAGF